MNTAILIRRLTPDDAADVAAFMSDEAVFGGLMQLPHPTVEMWRKRLAEVPVEALNLAAEQGGKVVGSAGLHPVNPGTLRRRHVMGLGISVAVAAQRQGVGRALMEAVLDWADNWGQVLRIELQVYADNTRAIALYESCGFVHEGTHPAYALRKGEYVTSLSYARLHPKPPNLHSR